MNPLLHEVLEVHDAWLPARALPGVLGDGYLYANNPFFRDVRELAIGAGFAFSSAPPFPYAMLPLLCLEPIWESRCIPFVENVPALRSVEERAPRRMAFWEVAEFGLKKTATFHESVHCIARTILRQLPPDPSRRAPSRRAVLDALFEESCANASEPVCAALGSTSLHRLFAKLHFYDTHDGIGVALEKLGFGDTLRVLVAAYLYSNFLYESVPRKVVERTAQHLIGEEARRALGADALHALFHRAFTLSRDFRVRTTSVSMKLSGHDAPLPELLDFDFASELEPGRRIRTALDAFVWTVERGTFDGAASKTAVVSRRALPSAPRRLRAHAVGS